MKVSASLQPLGATCLLSAGWYSDPVRGSPEAAGDRAGTKGPRGRVQVCHQVQDLQHQQPVDLSARHQEAAREELHGPGDHRQPKGDARFTAVRPSGRLHTSVLRAEHSG